MKIKYQNKSLEVVKTKSLVKVTRVGIRTVYKDKAGLQQYVKCFSKWWKFPQEVEY